jgi:HhH-GPD superfamily base excision DNA repair protein
MNASDQTSDLDELAYKALSAADPVLGRLTDEYGMPNPFVFHDGGRTTESNFAAMTLHILGQQISTKVAFVLYDRLTEASGGTPTTGRVLKLGPDRIRQLGTSRSKAGYLLDLANHVLTGQLDIEGIDALTGSGGDGDHRLSTHTRRPIRRWRSTATSDRWRGWSWCRAVSDPALRTQATTVAIGARRLLNARDTGVGVARLEAAISAASHCRRLPRRTGGR